MLRTLSIQQLETSIKVTCQYYVELLLNWSTDADCKVITGTPGQAAAAVSTAAAASCSGVGPEEEATALRAATMGFVPPPSAIEVITFYMKTRRFPNRSDIVFPSAPARAANPAAAQEK